MMSMDERDFFTERPSRNLLNIPVPLQAAQQYGALDAPYEEPAAGRRRARSRARQAARLSHRMDDDVTCKVCGKR